MSTPTVPPRPTRASAGPTEVKETATPQVPPRPLRKFDPSPSREEYSRSPLNELPPSLGSKSPAHRSSRSNLVPADVPPRPPSVSLPSIGQEGSEYSSYDQLPPEAHGVSGDSGSNAEGVATPHQTRNVSATMPLHAPKASVPHSTAKSRIETVTGTDSTQAAAAGIGRAQPEDDVHRTPSASLEASSSTAGAPLGRVPSRSDYHYHNPPVRRVASTEPHSLEQRAHADRSTSSLGGAGGTHSKAASIHTTNEDEHGIPEIGRQIPLYRNAGDVQAPTAGPSLPPHAPGIGFFNDGSSASASSRNHQRRRSSRQEFGPPDSYGLHGHSGQKPQDQFDRDWMAKHPKEVAMEGYNAYGSFHSPRSTAALSTEQLNKLVNMSGTDPGMGSNGNTIGTPSWEIANQATMEYTSRYSPKPPSVTTERKKRASSGSLPAVESPLRRTHAAPDQEVAIKDDGTIIHINEPERNLSHVTGGGPSDGAIDLGPKSGNTAAKGGMYEERGPGTPILASDETLKRPGSAYMHPAISPELRPSDDVYYDYSSDHGHDSRRSSWHVPSRPSSRPNSVHGASYHGGNLHRFISHEEFHGSGVHTPLEEIEEYEPLFPEEEANALKPTKSKTFPKRPGLEHHHFPSQDIWEDTPSSLQYSTTVQTPDLPHDQKLGSSPPSKGGAAGAFETPEQEQRRRDVNPEGMLSDSKMVPQAKPRFKAAVQDDLERPGMQRFPSSDIWEDTPDSMRLVTTVSAPQSDREILSPPEDGQDDAAADDDDDADDATASSQPARPTIPARPQRKSKLAEEVTPDAVDPTTAVAAAKSSLSRPTVPERPRPQIPARPARGSATATAAPAAAARGVSGNDASPLLEAAVTSSAAAAAATATTAKSPPAVPARPSGAAAGGNFAALKSGFMNDLNQRLKLGPGHQPAPKSGSGEGDDGGDNAAAAAEKVADVPLSDARKGRARGPPRRKAAPAPAAAAEGQKLSFSSLVTVWEIPDHDDADTTTTTTTTTSLARPQAPTSTKSEVRRGLQSALAANETQNTAEDGPTAPASQETTEEGSTTTTTAIETDAAATGVGSELESEVMSKSTLLTEVSRSGEADGSGALDLDGAEGEAEAKLSAASATSDKPAAAPEEAEVSVAD